MEQLKAKTDALDRHVQDLSSKTDANTTALTEVRKAVQRDRARTDRDRKLTLAAFLVGLLIIGAVGFVAFRAERTSRELDDYIQKVACPFYSLILGSYAPETRKLNADGSYPGSDREKYDRNFEDMRNQRATMHCRAELVPPRTNG
jgi:hypothetical protein